MKQYLLLLPGMHSIVLFYFTSLEKRKQNWLWPAKLISWPNVLRPAGWDKKIKALLRHIMPFYTVLQYLIFHQYYAVYSLNLPWYFLLLHLLFCLGCPLSSLIVWQTLFILLNLAGMLLKVVENDKNKSFFSRNDDRDLIKQTWKEMFS